MLYIQYTMNACIVPEMTFKDISRSLALSVPSSDHLDFYRYQRPKK